jgi:hypothetical protein
VTPEDLTDEELAEMELDAEGEAWLLDADGLSDEGEL